MEFKKIAMLTIMMLLLVLTVASVSAFKISSTVVAAEPIVAAQPELRVIQHTTLSTQQIQTIAKQTQVAKTIEEPVVEAFRPMVIEQPTFKVMVNEEGPSSYTIVRPQTVYEIQPQAKVYDRPDFHIINPDFYIPGDREEPEAESYPRLLIEKNIGVWYYIYSTEVPTTGPYVDNHYMAKYSSKIDGSEYVSVMTLSDPKASWSMMENAVDDGYLTKEYVGKSVVYVASNGDIGWFTKSSIFVMVSQNSPDPRESLPKSLIRGPSAIEVSEDLIFAYMERFPSTVQPEPEPVLLPDLTIKNVGQFEQRFEATVCNEGTVKVTNVPVRFLIDDTSSYALYEEWLHPRSCTSLYSDTFEEMGLKAGEYRIGISVRVDYTSTIEELNEDNNALSTSIVIDVDAPEEDPESYPKILIESAIGDYNYLDSSMLSYEDGALSTSYRARYRHFDHFADEQWAMVSFIRDRELFDSQLATAVELEILDEHEYEGHVYYMQPSLKGIGWFSGEKFIMEIIPASVDADTMLSAEIFMAYLERYPNTEAVEEPENQAPVLAPVGNQTVEENQTLTIQLSATDADDDSLMFSTTAEFGELNPEDGLFTWTPDFNASGNYTVVFFVSDGLEMDAQKVMITVLDLVIDDDDQTDDNQTDDDDNSTEDNTAPVLGVLTDMTVDENETITIQLEATDADNDTLFYDVVGSVGSINSTTGLYSWTPSFEAAGEYGLVFTVNDGNDGMDVQQILITVVDVQLDDNQTGDNQSDDNQSNTDDSNDSDDNQSTNNGSSNDESDISVKISQKTDDPEKGDDVEFEITIKNTGDLTLDDIDLKLEFDDELKFKACTDSCDEEDDELEWDNLGTLDEGEELVIEVEFELDDDSSNSLKAIVSATDSEGDSVSDDHRLSVDFETDDDDDSNDYFDYQQSSARFNAVDDGSWQPSTTASSADVLADASEVVDSGDIEVVYSQPRMILIEEKVCKFRLFWLWCVWWETEHTYVPAIVPDMVSTGGAAVAQATGVATQAVASQATVSFDI